MNGKELSANGIKEVIRHIIKNNRVLQKDNKKPSAIEIQGHAGLGKTAIVKQIAKEFNVQFVKLSLAQLEEVGDLIGFPIRQFEMCKKDECLWIDEPAVKKYEEEGYNFTGTKRMSYCPPEWISGKGEGGILLLDDYSR